MKGGTDRLSREAALRALDDRLTAGADQLEPRLARAGLLSLLGRFDEARADYLAVLAQAPTHLEALNDLGTLLHSTGFLTAARSCYAEAITHHPKAPRPRVNFANMLLEAGELAQARQHYEAALAEAPAFAEAHQGLSRIFSELGDEEKARHHRRLGFRERFLVERPYYGEGEGVALLVLVAAAGGNIATRFLIDDRVYRCFAVVADFFDAAAPLPPHAAVFNAIGDADLARPALEAARGLLASSTVPIINAPEVVLATGRVEVATRLARIPGLVTPRTMALPREVLLRQGAAALRAHGFEFPLLLRRAGYHTGRHFLRLASEDELAPALSALPGPELIAIEFLDARGVDGFWRKYRVMIVDGQILPMHLAVANDWKVHHFSSGMAEHAGHRAEEARFLADMRGALGPDALAVLERVRAELALDYGGVDFALDRDGRLLLFEANAGMVVNPPEPAPLWDYRRHAVARILDAVRAMLSSRAAVRGAGGSAQTRGDYQWR